MSNEAEVNRIKAEIEKTENKIEQKEKEYQEELGKVKREQEETRPGRKGAKTSIGELMVKRQQKNDEVAKYADNYFNGKKK